jgi:hypothetical protein
MPCLVYAGDLDKPAWTLAQQAVEHMPQAEFVSLPGLDHLAGLVRSDLMLPHARSFMAR